MGLFSKLFKKKDKKSEEDKKSAVNVQEAEKEPVKAEEVKEESVNAATVQKNAEVEAAPALKKMQETKNEAPVKQQKEETKQKAQTPTPKKETVKRETKPKAEEPKEEITEALTSGKDNKAYTGKFEINRSKDGKKFFFNLFASNKVGIATSQMYSSAQSALNGVNSVIVNAPKAPIEDQSLKSYEALPYPKWEIYVDNGGKYRFRLSASNGSCVCHSQGYTTKTACKNGIESIIRSSKNAEIVKAYLVKDE